MTNSTNSNASPNLSDSSHIAPLPSAQPSSEDWLNADPLGLDDGFVDSFDENLNGDMSENDPTLNTQDTYAGDTSRANPNFVPLLQNLSIGRPARQLIMDTETTGLDALNGDRIIEVGIVELVGRKFTGENCMFISTPSVVWMKKPSVFMVYRKRFCLTSRRLTRLPPNHTSSCLAEIVAHNAPLIWVF